MMEIGAPIQCAAVRAEKPQGSEGVVPRPCSVFTGFVTAVQATTCEFLDVPQACFFLSASKDRCAGGPLDQGKAEEARRGHSLRGRGVWEKDQCSVTAWEQGPPYILHLKCLIASSYS